MSRVLWSSSSFSPAYRVPECRSRRWWLVDARGHRVGRLAQEIKRLLEGKWKPTYVKGVDCGDFVVVINAKHVQFSGKKWDHKVYTSHTGYPRGLRQMKVLDVLQRTPTEIIKKAAMGQIHKGRLREAIEERLCVYPGIEHPHKAQKPTIYFPNKSINDTAWPILEHEEEFEVTLDSTKDGVKFDTKIIKMHTTEDRLAKYHAKKAGEMRIKNRRKREMPEHLREQGFVPLFKLEDEQQQSLLKTLRREQYNKFKHLLDSSREEGEKAIVDYEHTPQEWIRQPKERMYPPRTQNDGWNYDNVYGYIDKDEWNDMEFPLDKTKKFAE